MSRKPESNTSTETFPPERIAEMRRRVREILDRKPKRVLRPPAPPPYHEEEDSEEVDQLELRVLCRRAGAGWRIVR